MALAVSSIAHCEEQDCNCGIALVCVFQDSSLENGAYVFIPHSQAVSCLHFSPVNPAHLLSLSHDGTLRSGDVTQRIFEEVNISAIK